MHSMAAFILADVIKCVYELLQEFITYILILGRRQGTAWTVHGWADLQRQSTINTHFTATAI